jgi:putative endonuclease
MRVLRRRPLRHLLGNRAERRAERLLRRRGLRTLTRNYARRSGEIDLVMLDGETLAFVEVRYRGRSAWSTGIESVDRAKQRRIVRTAERYLAEHPQHRFRQVRFDVVAASARNYGIACEWTPDAFQAMDC